ncbi:hypothetical protein PSA7680_02774 [Pseudoruegeria aquimaris]|uniref:DUF3726 domain-containing protein n=1 Tax=Pseudoruegeria aquimaris TaxID=393663 RepID=A0A1Y5T1C9_9RHOB|nr:DUF3726 domain-containing protein [Pseudoruegeria aquimaris]SLN53396.1 hypothetical protein PSA7680_02774 [Pseudoruegeria aquimaris]
MSVSLNEVEALARRAARGAGYTWGQAEEAGKAARWLCAQGLDGCAALARLLEQGLQEAPQAHRPGSTDRTWESDDGLCPLSAGPLLSDAAFLLEEGPIAMKEVYEPLLLLPFAACAARRLHSAVTLEIDRLTIRTDGHRLDAPEGFPEVAQGAVIARGGAPRAPRPLQSRAHPAPEAWESLNAFAHRTYAPATEDSRRRGAGAGLFDND